MKLWRLGLPAVAGCHRLLRACSPADLCLPMCCIPLLYTSSNTSATSLPHPCLQYIGEHPATASDPEALRSGNKARALLSEEANRDVLRLEWKRGPGGAELVLSACWWLLEDYCSTEECAAKTPSLVGWNALELATYFRHVLLGAFPERLPAAGKAAMGCDRGTAAGLHRRLTCTSVHLPLCSSLQVNDLGTYNQIVDANVAAARTLLESTAPQPAPAAAAEEPALPPTHAQLAAELERLVGRADSMERVVRSSSTTGATGFIGTVYK